MGSTVLYCIGNCSTNRVSGEGHSNGHVVWAPPDRCLRFALGNPDASRAAEKAKLCCWSWKIKKSINHPECIGIYWGLSICRESHIRHSQAHLLFFCAQLCNFFVFVRHCVTSMVLGMQNLCIESCMCRPQKAQTHEPTTNLDRHEIYIDNFQQFM